MDLAPWLWLLITAGGAALLGLAIAYNMAITRRRRQNAAAQRRTDAATREVYRQEEAERKREEAG
jgi:hypothetical protein